MRSPLCWFTSARAVHRNGNARRASRRPSPFATPITRRGVAFVAAFVSPRLFCLETPIPNSMGTFASASAAAASPFVRTNNATAVSRASRASCATRTPCVSRRLHTGNTQLVSKLLASHRRRPARHADHHPFAVSAWSLRLSTERAARGQAFAVSEAHEESMENTEVHDTTDASTTAMSSSDETQDFGSNEPSLDDDDDEDEDSDSYDAAADGYESFVKKWRAQMDDSLFATPAARVDAHKASCAEGRRSANEKRKKRQVRGGGGVLF